MGGVLEGFHGIDKPVSIGDQGFDIDLP